MKVDNVNGEFKLRFQGRLFKGFKELSLVRLLRILIVYEITI